jgi:phage N-6-adenine-methyltransferase
MKTVSTENIQDRATPQSLVDLIARRFGVNIVIDLAASEENKKCHFFIGEQENSLNSEWFVKKAIAGTAQKNICAWLNPPFKSVGPWMEKCKHESEMGCKIISLTLSSLGANWYRDHVEGNALSLVLRDRVIFEGCKDPFPKELMVTLWGFSMTGLGFWSWKS